MKEKQIVAKYFEYLTIGQFEALGELFADDVVWHQPGNGTLSGTYRGKTSLFGLFGEFMKRSEGTFKIDRVFDIMVNGNVVAATLSFSAQIGSQNISMSGVDIMRIENGKINEVHLFSQDQASEDNFWN